MTATQDIKPTSARAWKATASVPVELPSGNYIRIRRMSMATLLATGKLPNSLTGIIRQAIDKGTGMVGVEDKMAELMGNEKQLAEMARFMDELITLVSIEPKVHLPPKDDDDRDDDTLYTDEVDEADKSFLFQLVTGGTSDLEQFRQATEASMASLSGREDVQLPAERTAEAD